MDANVLVSGMINACQPPGRIMDMIRSAALQIIADDRILAEYQDVLMRERLRAWLTETDARNLLSFLLSDTERIVSTAVVTGLPDSDDAPFIEVAMTASVPLITGNIGHFPADLCRGHQVLSPAEYLRLR